MSVPLAPLGSTHRKFSSIQHHPFRQLPPAAQNVRQNKIGAAPDFLPEENRFVGNGFFSGENVRDVPNALHLVQQQVHAVLVADLLTAFVQFRTCGFVRRQVSRQFIAENESSDELRTPTAIEPEKLPPGGAGEVHLRLFSDTAFIARKHKDDLPLNPDTATNCTSSNRQTFSIYSRNAFLRSTAAPFGRNLLPALPCF